VLLAGVSACASPIPSIAPTTLAQRIRLGSNTSLPGALPAVAAQKGYFASAGVEVQLETVNSAQDATVLVATRQLDAAVAGFTAGSFNAIERGLDVRIVGSLGAAPTGYRSSIMVRKDLIDRAQVRTVADLKGRRIGSFGGASSSATYQIAQALRDGGVNITDVDLVNLNFPDTMVALRSGAIDAAYLPVPFSTDAIKTGIAVRLGGVLEEEAGPFTVGVIFGSGFVADRPAAGRALMLALVRAARELRGQGYRTPENLAILNGHVRVPVAALEASGSIEFTPDLHPDTDTLLDMQRVWMELGALSYSTPLPIERLADSSFSTHAANMLGPDKP
jgi:NitT/TauT family transport system substrate-binding protein